ncbi:MAG: adenylate/guanylate cyclase domain-containing protein [Desulfuromonadaceae bacterium]|nr:adenylate/guanylate cyclase domain-containing protein [Desulfuromonadaceae bacterium]
MSKLIEERIRGTLRGAVILEFLKNSFHFPLANILIELVLEGPAHYVRSLDFYASIGAASIQAYFLGRWSYEGKPRPFVGNLIGPLFYSVVEIITAPDEFFSMPFHYAYWGFALGIGIIQKLRLMSGEERQELLILIENVIRSGILAVMYWLIEMLTEPKYADLSLFFTNKSHIFMLSALLFMSIIVGLDDARSQRFLHILRGTTEQLQTFSNWLFGRNMLSMAMTDPAALSLVRRERSVIFMDIRGFTGWSEQQEPETVVKMLNRYYETAETVLGSFNVIMLKFTADEVMAFFADAAEGSKAAWRLHGACTTELSEFGLSVGTGVNTGLVVEGLLGSSELKRYEIIGDTVNTAKRICSAAESGELLVSKELFLKTEGFFKLIESREITAKGKSVPLEVCVVELNS